MNLETLRDNVEKAVPRQGIYFYNQDNCPFNSSWKGKLFLGHLYFDNHKNVFQVFECPMCGKRDVIEIPWNEIDIDDPRYGKGGVITTDWQKRLGVKDG
jgi:hypothetical protein